MPGIVDNLAFEGGKVLVDALAGGLVSAAKKVAGLWCKDGEAAERRVTAELESGAAQLATGQETQAVSMRLAIVWETRLADLLATHPEVREELTALLAHLREQTGTQVHTTIQNVLAEGPRSIAQGVINGDIHNHGEPGQSA